MAESDRFCSTCLDVIKHLKGSINGFMSMFLHHPTAAKLRSAAASGCFFCSAFWGQFSDAGKTTMLELDQVYRESNPVDSSDYDTVVNYHATHVYMYGNDSPEGRRDILYRINTGYDREHHLNRSMRGWYNSFILSSKADVLRSQTMLNGSTTPTSRNTASTESWALVEQWIGHCLKSHTTCNKLKDHLCYPTRLLNVGTGNESTVRLVETSKEACKGRYVTLSHRWGDSEPYCLCEDNYNDLLKGVAITQLPQAFRDAIVVCRRLLIRYLWIDSLCIVQHQDSLQDWLREAGLMSQVYSHSFLNISAVGAADSGHSFFVERGSKLLEAPTVTTALRLTDRIELTGESRELIAVDQLFWDSEVNHASLNLRAWVLQERLLSPRVLHFGCQQLHWECCELDAAECFPSGIPSVVKGTHFKNTSKDELLTPDPLMLYMGWSNIVSAYSKCKLTQGRDKLVALAGIAKRMGDMLGDEYVVGMWRRYLDSELLWYVWDQGQHDGGYSHRPSSYRAPSFSWASVDGVVVSGTPRDSGSLMEVLDVQLQFVTHDTTGLVRDGSLLLKCCLQSLTMTHKTDAMEEGHNRDYRLAVNGIEVCGPRSMWAPDVYLDEHKSYFDPGKAEPGQLFCIPALDDGIGLYVMLLRLVDRERAAYARFGLARTVLHKEVFQRQADGMPKHPCTAYEDGAYAILLI